jgi:hypothetical protein
VSQEIDNVWTVRDDAYYIEVEGGDISTWQNKQRIFYKKLLTVYLA